MDKSLVIEGAVDLKTIEELFGESSERQF